MTTKAQRARAQIETEIAANLHRAAALAAAKFAEGAALRDPERFGNILPRFQRGEVAFRVRWYIARHGRNRLKVTAVDVLTGQGIGTIAEYPGGEGEGPDGEEI